MTEPRNGRLPVVFGVLLDDAGEDWPGRNQLFLSMTAHRPVIFLERRKGWRLTIPTVERLHSGALVIRGAFAFATSQRLRFLRGITTRLDGFLFERALRRAGLEPYCFWLETPRPDLLTHISPALVVYDSMDPCFIPALQEDFDVRERACVERADLVFATAAALERRMRALGADPIRLPNAAHKEDVKSVVTHDEARRELGLGDHPIAAYLGTVDSRFDLDLMTEVARVLQDWCFLIGGRVNIDREREAHNLRCLPNVCMMGPVDAATGRKVIAAADVCLIPFVEGPVSDAINSVKMFSYLAFGKPVVATDIEECRHNEFVITASGPASFSRAVRSAVALDRREQARRSFARSNTWDHRAAFVSDLFDHFETQNTS